MSWLNIVDHIDHQLVPYHSAPISDSGMERWQIFSTSARDVVDPGIWLWVIMKQGQSQTRQKYAVYHGISCQYIYRLICSVPLSRDLFSARILWGGRTCYALWRNVGPGLLNCFCKCKTFLEEIDTAVWKTRSHSPSIPRLARDFHGLPLFWLPILFCSDKVLIKLSIFQRCSWCFPPCHLLFFQILPQNHQGFSDFFPEQPSEIGDDRSSARHYVADAKDPTNFKQLNATCLESVEKLHLPQFWTALFLWEWAYNYPKSTV